MPNGKDPGNKSLVLSDNGFSNFATVLPFYLNDSVHLKQNKKKTKLPNTKLKANAEDKTWINTNTVFTDF